MMRPRLLVRAAQAGAARYYRSRDLPKDLRGLKGPALINALTRMEADCDRQRREGAPSYGIGRHIRLLATLIAETRRQEIAA